MREKFLIGGHRHQRLRRSFGAFAAVRDSAQGRTAPNARTLDSLAGKIQGSPRDAVLQADELLPDRGHAEHPPSGNPNDHLPGQRLPAPQFATRAVWPKLANAIIAFTSDAPALVRVSMRLDLNLGILRGNTRQPDRRRALQEDVKERVHIGRRNAKSAAGVELSKSSNGTERLHQVLTLQQALIAETEMVCAANGNQRWAIRKPVINGLDVGMNLLAGGI